MGVPPAELLVTLPVEMLGEEPVDVPEGVPEELPVVGAVVGAVIGAVEVPVDPGLDEVVSDKVEVDPDGDDVEVAVVVTKFVLKVN